MQNYFLPTKPKVRMYFPVPYHFPSLIRFFHYSLLVDLLSVTVAFLAGSFTVQLPQSALPSISLSLVFSFATIHLTSTD